MNDDLRKTEKDYSYRELQIIREKAKKYDSVNDKKEFLRKLSPYEQKIVLLETKNPYEALKYLEELDLPNTQRLLEQLDVNEISNILALFSAEDKEAFYTNFSNLSLVNEFIVHDKNASNYIEDLEVDRKIDLLNSSDQVMASYKILESVSDSEKREVIENVTTVDGINVINNITSLEAASSTTQDKLENVSEEAKNSEIKSEEKTEEKIVEEKQSEEKLIQQNPEQQLILEKNEFLKSLIQHYIETIPEFKNVDMTIPDLYQSLAPELRSIVDNDFIKMKESQKNNANENKDQSELEVENKNDLQQSELELFKQAQSECEKLNIEDTKALIADDNIENQSVKIM